MHIDDLTLAPGRERDAEFLARGLLAEANTRERAILIQCLESEDAILAWDAVMELRQRARDLLCEAQP